jgi:hypothetical protein
VEYERRYGRGAFGAEGNPADHARGRRDTHGLAAPLPDCVAHHFPPQGLTDFTQSGNVVTSIDDKIFRHERNHEVIAVTADCD